MRLWIALLGPGPSRAQFGEFWNPVGSCKALAASLHSERLRAEQEFHRKRRMAEIGATLAPDVGRPSGAERLEQLRFLENGLSIQVHETTHETLGIDLPEDLSRALDWISSQIV